MRFGHYAEATGRSDDDGQGEPLRATRNEYNRAGDIDMSQTVSGNISFDLDLNNDNSVTDLNIDGQPTPNAIAVGHYASQYAVQRPTRAMVTTAMVRRSQSLRPSAW